jgi:hypothetical protein
MGRATSAPILKPYYDRVRLVLTCALLGGPQWASPDAAAAEACPLTTLLKLCAMIN